MAVVTERTTCYLNVSFKDKAGCPQAPVSCTWKAHDLESGKELQAETPIAPAGTVEIEIPPAVNVIQVHAKPYEIRLITIRAVYGAADEINAAYSYRVANLVKVI